MSAHRVPYLQLDLLVVDGDEASPELNSDREVVDRLEALVCELQQQATLSDTWMREISTRRECM